MSRSELPPVEYIADSAVDATLDQELRQLLSTCFTGPNDGVFRKRRYFRQPPTHRWLVRSGPTLVAQIAAHEKIVCCGDTSHPVGGIAEVCVHPDYRGRGYVKHLLLVIHPWLAVHSFDYALLFGRTAVYASSGYFPAENLYLSESPGEAVPGGMVRPLRDCAWPHEPVLLLGPRF